MKFDFGYIWKMYIGESFTKCKSQIPILIHVFPILLNEKVLPFSFSWYIFWYIFHVKIIPEKRWNNKNTDFCEQLLQLFFLNNQ